MKIYKKLCFFVIIALFGVGCINVGNCYEDTTYLLFGEYTCYFVNMDAGDNLTWSFDTWFEEFEVWFYIGGSGINNTDISKGLVSNSGIWTAPITARFLLTFVNLDIDLFRNGYIDIYFEVNVPPPILPGPFTLTSTATNPDTDGSFSLQWTASADSDNYSVYQDNILLSNGVTSLSNSITINVNGTYDFKVIAYNINGETESNEINVIVAIPFEEPGLTPDLIPSFNPLLIFGIIGCISAISAIVINKRMSEAIAIISSHIYNTGDYQKNNLEENFKNFYNRLASDDLEHIHIDIKTILDEIGDKNFQKVLKMEYRRLRSGYGDSMLIEYQNWNLNLNYAFRKSLYISKHNDGSYNFSEPDKNLDILQEFLEMIKERCKDAGLNIT